MVFSYYGGFGAQADSTAVTQFTDAELLGALDALAAGLGYPPRGATAADVRAAGNLLIGEAIKRRLPVPAKLAGGSVTDTSAPNMDAALPLPTASTAAASTAAPEKSNTGLIIGGLAVAAAAFFLLKK